MELFMLKRLMGLVVATGRPFRNGTYRVVVEMESGYELRPDTTYPDIAVGDVCEILISTSETTPTGFYVGAVRRVVLPQEN